jgi:hypothetical protein
MALLMGDLLATRAKNEEVHKPMTTEDLERYTQFQWGAVVHFLVGSRLHEK